MRGDKMDLYLVRHGDALPEFMGPERRLSSRGREEVALMAQYLKSHSVAFDAVWHSGKPRALETAGVIAGVTGYRGGLIQKSRLDPGDSPEFIFEQIREFLAERPQGALMIVGHLPFLGVLAALLLTGAKSAKDFIEWPTAGVLCLQAGVFSVWRLRWILTPAMISG